MFGPDITFLGVPRCDLEEPASYADADVVIEAVFEDLKVKQQVFAEVEAVVSETCILATNTSSLSVTDMAVRSSSSQAQWMRC